MAIYGWQRYKGIEKDFIDAQFYISFEVENGYSEFFSREVVLLGVEIEAAFKKLCYVINGSAPGNIGEYKNVILEKYPGITDINVKNNQNDTLQKPFENWGIAHLSWWDAYTNTKHNLVDRKATVKVALTMLQAYELLLFCISASTSPKITLEYMDIPRLYIPDFKPGFALTRGMTAILHFDSKDIIRELKKNKYEIEDFGN